MAADDITFNLVVNTGNSDANIRAINNALSDFGRVALRAETNAKSAGTALDRWLAASRNITTAKKAYDDLARAADRAGRSTRRASMDAAGNISTSGGARVSRTETQRTRVQRPAGPPGAGSGFVQETDRATTAVASLDAQEKTNIATKNQLTSSTQRSTIALTGYANQSAALRYALYDLSNAAALTSAGLAVFPILAAKGAIDAELAFANVARTTGLVGKEAETLKNQFLELSQAMPTSFGEIANVGTLAGQLGVANSELESFVKNTIQFSTVSSLSAEDSATAFARLNQLIPSVNGNYEALGSAILKVGTESAATESEIVAVAQQIAPVANSFNMSAASVIGLSGALASLKVPPELSRGMLQRTFAEVNQAISTNSSSLEEYGRVAGMTGAEFKSAWLGNSTDAFVSLLRGIDQEGGAAEGTLTRLGITSSRDAATLKRLAQNVDGTLVPALENASIAYGSADEQQKQFDKIAQTLAKRLEQLASNFNNFLMVAGSGVSVFGGLLDAANGFLGYITDIANNPFGKWFLGIIGGATALIAILLGFAAIALRVRASIIAMNQAISGMSIAMAEARAAAVATSGSLTMVGKAAAISGVSVKAFKAALISTGIGAVVVVLGSLVGMLIEMGSASDNAKAGAESMFGSFDDLRSAMEADAKAAKDTGEAVVSYSDYLKKSGKEIDSTGHLIDVDSSKRAENVDVIDKQKAALDGYGTAIGKATRGKIADAFIKSDDFKKIDEFNQKLSELGQENLQIDMSKVLDFVSTGDNAGLQAYLDGLQAQVTASIQSLDTSSLAPMFNPGDFFGPTTAQKSEEAFGAVRAAAESTATAIGIAGSQATSSIDAWVTGADDAANSTDEWGMTIDDVINGMKEVKDTASKGFAMSEAVDASVSSYQNLLDALSESGGSLNQGFAEGRSSAQSFQSAIVDTIGLAEGMGLTAAEGVNIVYSNMIANGANAADVQAQLLGLVQSGVISSIQMSQIMAGTLAMSPKAANLAAQFGKLKANVGGAAEKMVTLIDYANDLSSVWKRAFDIRFSGQNTLDDITSAFQDISDTTKDAKQNINDLQADLDSLTADKALQEYFLSVANAYGDTLAAAQIQAKLNKINNEITSTNQDLSDAQSDANKTLVGNSAAAVANRKTITSLVSTYQSHIQALAASGMSQEQLAAETATLKQQFLDQATQLGYNRDELGTYAVAFDDVSTAIANVPRNVNVEANTNPALQALNEFAAKSRAAIASAGGRVNIDTSGLDGIGAAAGDTFKRGFQRGANGALIFSDGSGRMVGSPASIRFVARGGYISGPGSATSDSIPAQLSNGEYVVRAAAVSKYGAGFFEQLNQMRTPRFASGGLVSAPQMGGIVSLSPEDRALLRNVGGSGEVVLYANNEAIARSANAGNRAIIATGGLS